MAKTEVLNGDQIAAQIKGRTENSNMADIAREVHDMMDHTKDSSKDLAKVNEALHAAGILPGIDITGVQGQDFIGRNPSGAVVRLDSADLDHVKVDATSKTTTINGRDATLNADGSGTVTVKPGDGGLKISRDMLKSQGNENPTDREVAMYNEQLNNLNGSAMKHLHPGDVLKLPPALKDGANSSFVPERANDAEAKTKDQINSDKDAVWAAFAKNTQWTLGAGYNVTKTQLDSALAPGNQLTDQQRQGFQFMKDNWNLLSRNGAIWENEVTAWQKTALRQAELDSFVARKDG